MLDQGGVSMSLRQNYVTILSRILPAGAVGVSGLLRAAAPAFILPPRNLRLRMRIEFPNGSPPFARRSLRWRRRGGGQTRPMAIPSSPGETGGTILVGTVLGGGPIGTIGGIGTTGIIGGIIGRRAGRRQTVTASCPV